MSTGVPAVSVVIPNYMGAHLLPDTLDRLEAALRNASSEVEVIVSDDASTDGSARAVERERPGVRVLHAERNGGFGAACNRGARAAAAPLLLFLNSDTHVTPGFLEPMLAHFRDPAVFSVMPLMTGDRGELQQPALTSLSVRRGMLRLVHPAGLGTPWAVPALRRLGPLPTLYATGGAMLVRRDRFLELDGFAAMLAPFYYEDLDLGWRAWRRGWRTLLEPGATVEHQGGATIGTVCDPREVRVLRKRNRTLVLWRNLLDDGTLLRRHALQVPLHQLGRLMRGDATSLDGLRAAWRVRAAVRVHRRAERAAARMRDDELVALLDEAIRRVEREIDAARRAPRTLTRDGGRSPLVAG